MLQIMDLYHKCCQSSWIATEQRNYPPSQPSVTGWEGEQAKTRKLVKGKNIS